MRVRFGYVWALPFLIACSGSDEEGGQSKVLVRLTTEVTLQPEHAVLTSPDSRASSNPEYRAEMLAEGYGNLVEGAGEPHVTRAPPAQTPPAAGAAPKLLARFAHMPDLQINDDESPNRLANFDSPGTLSGAFRPQDHDLCRMTNAAVKTVNQIHEKTPIDFLLLGGDNADSAQQNEVDWVIGILGGGSVSAIRARMTIRKGVDGKDPFEVLA
jgi:hypothetical protein